MPPATPGNPSWLGRLLRRRPAPQPALTDDGTLVVVGECFDPARADSAAVADMVAAGADLGARPHVLRHVVRLPGPAAVAEARRLLEADGWTVRPAPAGDRPGGEDDAGGAVVYVSRQQPITGLEIARERSRMAGLAQRLGGDADGWQVLARPGGGAGGTAPS